MSKQLHQKPRSEASLSDEYSTPKELFIELQETYQIFPFIDVAANNENTKCKSWFDKKSNALIQEWNSDVYCNPPNSLTQKFIKKADEQYNKHNINIIMLIPINATVTKAGKKYIWDNPDVEIHPVIPTPKFIYNGVQGESARNRYCVVLWRKRNG